MKVIILFLCFFLIFSLAYGQEVSSSIKTLLSSQGKVIFGDEPNSIMVIDYPENIQRVVEYLEIMDVLPQQVLIEARVIEVKLQKEHSLGVNWKAFADKGYLTMGRFKAGSGYPEAPGLLEQNISYKPTFYPPGQSTAGQESPFTFAIFDDNINVVLKALSNSLDTDILSAPSVTTVNNRLAEIKIIQKLPWAEPTLSSQASGTGSSSSVSVTWKVNFEEVGITLKVTPTINEENKIALTLNPEVSDKTSDYSLTVTQGTTSVPYTVPVIDKRSASTKVVIGNGQTLIIGGLIKQKNTKGVTKIPLLGDLPLLGYLFKSKKDTGDKTELLIFVSPTIITPDEFVRMKNEERFGIGKDYSREREKRKRLFLTTQEEEEKVRKSKFNAALDVLTQKEQP